MVLASLRSICSDFSIPSRTLSRARIPHSVSGCRESNPDRIHPMDVYYHYTTARFLIIADVHTAYGIFEIFSICVTIPKPEKEGH